MAFAALTCLQVLSTGARGASRVITSGSPKEAAIAFEGSHGMLVRDLTSITNVRYDRTEVLQAYQYYYVSSIFIPSLLMEVALAVCSPSTTRSNSTLCDIDIPYVMRME